MVCAKDTRHMRQFSDIQVEKQQFMMIFPIEK